MKNSKVFFPPTKDGHIKLFDGWIVVYWIFFFFFGIGPDLPMEQTSPPPSPSPQYKTFKSALHFYRFRESLTEPNAPENILSKWFDACEVLNLKYSHDSWTLNTDFDEVTVSSYAIRLRVGIARELRVFKMVNSTVQEEKKPRTHTHTKKGR